MRKILFLVFAQLPLFLFAQEIPSQTVTGIPTKNAVQIVEQAANDLGYRLSEFEAANKIIVTDWIEWTSVAIANHARLRFVVSNDEVIITMTDRQYKSSEGWSNTPSALSKKNHEKFLGTFATKIAEINSNEKLTENAVYNSTLIKIFKQSIVNEGLEWKFIKADKILDEKAHTVVQLSVTNKTNGALTVSLGDFGFRESIKGGDGTKNGYSVVSFDELSGRITKSVLSAGETKSIYLYSLMKENFPEVIPFFEMGVTVQNKKYDLKNFNMPIPFNNAL
jgi:hypothetical protein